MELKLYSWYTQLKSNNLPVTPKMIKHKALSITKFADFIASKGWLEKFKKKFNLTLNRESQIDNVKCLPNVSSPNTDSTSFAVNCSNSNTIIFKSSNASNISINESKSNSPMLK